MKVVFEKPRLVWKGRLYEDLASTTESETNNKKRSQNYWVLSRAGMQTDVFLQKLFSSPFWSQCKHL